MGHYRRCILGMAKKDQPNPNLGMVVGLLGMPQTDMAYPKRSEKGLTMWFPCGNMSLCFKPSSFLGHGLV